MRFAGLSFSRAVVSLVLVLAFGSFGLAQDTGEADLDKAFEAKIKAQSTRDLEEVAELCESAIDKGLDESGEKQAKELWASALLEHAQQLGRRIMTPQRDRRWRKFRADALGHLEKAVELKPELVEAYTLIARLNVLEDGDRDAAEEALEKAVKLSGDDMGQKSEVLFLRAVTTSDTEQRLKDLNEAIKIDDGNVDALKFRAAYFNSRAQSYSRQAGRALVRGDQEKSKELTAKVTEYLKLSAADFESWHKKESKSLEATVRLADIYTNLKDYENAVKALDSAAKLAPDNVGIFVSRARIRLMQEKDELALKDLTKAIKIDRQNTDALLMRSSVLLSSDRFDEALDDVNAVLENEPSLVRGIAIRSSILAAKEDFSGAIKDTKLLADNFPQQPAYRRQLAMLYNADKQPSKAVKIYERMLESNDEPKTYADKIDRVASLRGRGDAFLSLGKHKEAISDYDEALKLMPVRDEEKPNEMEKERLSGILNNLAWVLATSTFDDLRDGKRAIKLATRAAELTDYKASHILSTLASGYAETGDFDNAKKHAQDAIGKSEDDDQKESLGKELASYEKNEAWRELQNDEEDRKKEKKAESKSESNDDDDQKKSDGAEKDGDKKSDDDKSSDDDGN